MGNLKRIFKRNRKRSGALLTLLIFAAVIVYLIGFYDKNDQKLINAYVINVIDGDTIIADVEGQERKVRLIGIDTPESVSEISEENTEEGILASEYTRSRLLNRTVTLETDVQKTDKYGRLLAYIYMDNRMLNLELLETGYARVLTVPPNIKYEKKFLDAQARAIIQKKGFWNTLWNPDSN